MQNIDALKPSKGSGKCECAVQRASLDLRESLAPGTNLDRLEHTVGAVGLARDKCVGSSQIHCCGAVAARLLSGLCPGGRGRAASLRTQTIVERARFLLSHGTSSIAEIAANLGFSSQAHFDERVPARVGDHSRALQSSGARKVSKSEG